METPSSIRMLTQSQTSVASQKSKKDDSFSRSRALLDITNDSPIVGLATEKTPSSSVVKNRVRAVKNTSGSGEALLRGQVKTLLQKVEEEAEFVNNKLSSGDRPPFRVVLGLPGPSPVQLLAPTPANTPQVVVEGDGLKIAPIQVAEAVKPEAEEGECLINRALLFDSPEKSDITDVSSSLSYQGSEIRSYPEKSPDDDSSSAWSLQVNVSVQDDEDEEEEEEEEIGDFEDDEEEKYENAEDYYDEESFDDLCEGLSKMTVEDKFEGKHTRFVYNSDDEIEGEEVIGEEKNASPSKVVLKGLPVPEGKHLRFHDEEEEEDE